MTIFDYAQKKKQAVKSTKNLRGKELQTEKFRLS